MSNRRSTRSLETLRRDIHIIFAVGVKSVDPVAAVRRYVSREGAVINVGHRAYRIQDFDHIYVIGAGKAGAPMCQALEELIGEKITKGWVNVKYGHVVPLDKITIHEAGHPIPDESGCRGTKAIVKILAQAGERDLIICMISGGGSALLPLPVNGISLEEKQKVTQLLLSCGASINEINSIRKHISQVKGGGLARFAHPATVVSLMLSDVIGDHLDVIASGPTVPDLSTFADCLEILQKYKIKDQVSPLILKHLEKGNRGEISDTPKPGDPIFEKTQNLIIGSNAQAVQAAAHRSQELGYRPLILSTMVDGETREIAKMHAAIVKEVIKSGNPVSPPSCILSGGETTVTIKGKGTGGRNQEFVLASASELAGIEKVVVLSGGTDGTDGPTDAAGAVADGLTVKRALNEGMDPALYLNNNDSYHFFQRLDDLLVTGPTNTNVMDLRIMLIG